MYENNGLCEKIAPQSESQIGTCSSNELIILLILLITILQGHHHNGDQAARRPAMMCSIFVVADLRPVGLGVRGPRE